jgi:hypothetical protein
MIPQFYIAGAGERPSSQQTIFADGSADAGFREGTDVELSHWVPNRTPARYKADTSTEICLNFVADPLPGPWELAVNNHLDVDGVLSIYALVRGEQALARRETLVAASRMGDFWDWGDARAQNLFQGLTRYIFGFELGSTPLQAIYAGAFERIDALLAGAPAEQAGLAALAAAWARVESGQIGRTVLNERFVAYEIPRELVEQDLARALHIPAFNAPLDDAAWLPPQARNRLDREKIQLVSAAATGGWYHDLWYPGYRWAETPTAWVAPGFHFTGSTNGYRYGHAPLEAAVAALRAEERNPGGWMLAETLNPFKGLPGRNYPVILAFLNDQQQPTPSSQSPARVAATLATAFAP